MAYLLGFNNNIRCIEIPINAGVHTKLKRKITYKTAIKYDGYKLIKTIFENKLFIPFSIKDKY